MDNQILINRYLNSLRQSGKSILTLSAYATDLKQFMSLISPISLAAPISLTPEIIADCELKLKEKFSPNSQVRKLTTIREFLKWCFAKGYLKKDLSMDIKSVRRITISPARPLSQSQLYRLRSKADVKERLILELMIGTRLKLSAIVKLKMKNFNSLLFDLPLSVNVQRSTFNVQSFPPHLRQSLEYYLTQFPHGPKSYLLNNKFNRPMSVRTLSSILKNLSRRAGVKHGTFRNLRETSKT